MLPDQRPPTWADTFTAATSTIAMTLAITWLIGIGLGALPQLAPVLFK